MSSYTFRSKLFLYTPFSLHKSSTKSYILGTTHDRTATHVGGAATTAWYQVRTALHDHRPCELTAQIYPQPSRRPHAPLHKQHDPHAGMKEDKHSLRDPTIPTVQCQGTFEKDVCGNVGSVCERQRQQNTEEGGLYGTQPFLFSHIATVPSLTNTEGKEHCTFPVSTTCGPQSIILGEEVWIFPASMYCILR
jgi:hypothetical protein